MNPISETSKFTFLWEIKDFPLFLSLHQEELESPPFFVKCLEVIGWFLVLRPRDHVLDCYLYRLNRMDDLGDIHVECQISVVGENGILHFSERYTSTLINEVRSLQIPDFLDTRLLDDEHLLDGTLQLQCDLEITAMFDFSIEWNCNVHLMELSKNIQQLYMTGRGSDWRLKFDGTEFRIHSFIIAARCPEFRDFDSEDCTMESPPQSPHKTLTFRRIQQFVRLLELPPKSHVRKPFANSKASKSVREERFLKTFNASVCHNFLQYLYSGRLDFEMDSDMVLRLFIVARRYNLMDMVRKLQEVENKCTAVTAMVTDEATLDFDLGFLLGRDLFEPITQLVNLSSTDKKYLQVTFSTYFHTREGNCIHVYCQLIESVLPVTMKAEIHVFDRKFKDSKPIMIYKCMDGFFFQNEGWSLPLPVKIESNVRLKCTFTVCIHNSVTITKQEFSIRPNYRIEPISLRQLSYDLAAALAKSSIKGDDRCDLTFIVDGKALHVHRLVICAWSSFLRSSLEPVEKQPIANIEFDAMVSVIEYMYSGILFENDAEKVKIISEVARKFILPDLMDSCKMLLEE